jgi:hypothetical protein
MAHGGSMAREAEREAGGVNAASRVNSSGDALVSAGLTASVDLGGVAVDVGPGDHHLVAAKLHGDTVT